VALAFLLNVARIGLVIIYPLPLLLTTLSEYTRPGADDKSCVRDGAGLCLGQRCLYAVCVHRGRVLRMWRPRRRWLGISVATLRGPGGFSAAWAAFVRPAFARGWKQRAERRVVRAICSFDAQRWPRSAAILLLGG